MAGSAAGYSAILANEPATATLRSESLTSVQQKELRGILGGVVGAFAVGLSLLGPDFELFERQKKELKKPSTVTKIKGCGIKLPIAS